MVNSDKQMKFVFDWFCSEYAVQNVLHPEKVNDIYFIHSKMYWNPEDDLYQNSAANPEEEPSHDGVPFELYPRIFEIDKERETIQYPQTQHASFLDWHPLDRKMGMPDVKFLSVFDIVDGDDELGGIRNYEDRKNCKIELSLKNKDIKNLFYVVEILAGFDPVFKGYNVMTRNKRNSLSENHEMDFVEKKYNLFLNMSYQSLWLIRNKHMKLIISYMQEGTILDNDFYLIHDSIKEFGVSPDSVVLIVGSYNLYKRYDSWCKKSKIDDRIMVIQSYHYLEECSRYWGPHSDRIFHDEEAPFTKKEVMDLKDVLRDKYFLNFNGRISHSAWNRALLLASMIKNNIMEKGLVSCLTPTISDNVIPSELKKDFYLGFKKLQDKVPFILDVGIKTNIDGTKEKETSTKLGNEIYEQSYFSIAAETLWEHESFFFTEKTFRPITNLQPFILMTIPHSLKYLRDEFGIKTFHPFIDEGYDSIEDSIERFLFIEKEVIRLCNLPKQEIHDWFYSILDPILVHNQKIFFDFGKRSERKDIFNILVDKNYKKVQSKPGKWLLKEVKKI